MQYNTLPNFAWTQGTGTNDLSGNQYRAVKLDAQGAAAITAATDVVVGFQTDAPTGPNQYVALESNGIVLAECASAITKGTEVAITANGRIATSGGSNTIVGAALTDGAAGDIISIKLKNM